MGYTSNTRQDNEERKEIKEPSPIDTAMQLLAKNTNVLEELVGQLASALSPVLCDMTSISTREPEDDESEGMSNLNRLINMRSNDVERIIGCVRSLLNRLEL